jgi:hypothetical protein
MSEPTNADIRDRIDAVKGQLGAVGGNVVHIKEQMLTRAYFDAEMKKLTGKDGGKAGGGSAEEKKDEGSDWKTQISTWADALGTGVGKVVESLLAGKLEALTLAVVGLFGIQLFSWTNLLKNALDKRGFEEKPNQFLKYGKKPTGPQPQGPIRPGDIQNLKDARRVATALARSLTNLSQEMERVAQAAA